MYEATTDLNWIILVGVVCALEITWPTADELLDKARTGLLAVTLDRFTDRYTELHGEAAAGMLLPVYSTMILSSIYSISELTL